MHLSECLSFPSLPVSLYYMIIFDYTAHHVCYIFRRISHTVRIMHVAENLLLRFRYTAGPIDHSRKICHQLSMSLNGTPPTKYAMKPHITHPAPYSSTL